MGKTKPDYVVFIHRIYQDNVLKTGGLDIATDYLISKDKCVVFVEFPLYYKINNRIRVRRVKDNDEEILRDIPTKSDNEIICWVLESIYCIYYSLKYKLSGSVVISADPLTSFPAILLRKLGFFRFHYFHSVDYSKNRFSSKFVNYIHFIMMKFAVRNSDIVGVVSKPMERALQKMGAKKTFYLPNSVDYKYFQGYQKSIDERKEYSLVSTSAEISDKFQIFSFIKLINKLKNKFPKITLDIIGPYDSNINYYNKIQDYIRDNDLQNNITFHGLVPKKMNLEIVSQCQIGLSFHNKSMAHVKFADSLKIREYAALGLCIVANDAMSTSKEMLDENAGIVVSSIKSVDEVVSDLFNNKEKLHSYNKSALSWAKKMDKRLILDELYKELK